MFWISNSYSGEVRLHNWELCKWEQIPYLKVAAAIPNQLTAPPKYGPSIISLYIFQEKLFFFHYEIAYFLNGGNHYTHTHTPLPFYADQLKHATGPNLSMWPLPYRMFTLQLQETILGIGKKNLNRTLLKKVIHPE